MKSAIPCAMLWLAGFATAATIETTCEWIDTGEPCGVRRGNDNALYYTVEPDRVLGVWRVAEGVFPDVPPEDQWRTRLTYSHQDSLEFSVVVLGGQGAGILRGTAFEEYYDPDQISTNWPIGGLAGEEIEVPFTYGETARFFIDVDLFRDQPEGGPLSVRASLSFDLFAPEGAHFEEVVPVTENPEPGTAVLIAFGLLTLLYRQHRWCRI